MHSLIIKKKPTSAGVRSTVQVKHPFLYKGSPYKALLENNNKSGGRNNDGRITVRHVGGGHKQKYRIIDFKRNKLGVYGVVERLEYDPNRTAFIALIAYIDGDKRYIIAPKGLEIGQKIISDEKVPMDIGNCMPIKNIPLGSTIHCIEMKPNKGSQISRSAGCFAQLVAKEQSYASLKLSSGEIRKIFINCRAVIGEVSNAENYLKKLGKAGAKRWRNIRPTVRGVAMNPVDHPHGGGEGKTSGGRHPVSPTGVLAKGFKTRKKNKASNKFIVRQRNYSRRK